MSGAEKGWGRITRSSEYRKVYDTGVKLVGKYYMVFYKPSEKGTGVGITVSSKVGNAVVRNRAKRRTREAVNQAIPSVRAGADIVVVALGRIVRAPFDGLVSDLKSLFSRVKA